MTYTPPIAEQRFVLETIARIQDMAEHPTYAAATPDMVDAILEGLGEFAAGEYAPLNRLGDLEGAKWTPEGVLIPEPLKAAYRAFIDSGWGTIHGPEAFGGQGLPFILSVLTMEDLGTANMAMNLCNMLSAGAIESLIAHGTDEQRALYLPKLLTGEWTGTMNLTEPQAGSDVGALKSTATPLPNGKWSIKGTKIFITFGDHDMTDNIVHLVLARTPDGAAGTKGISLFLVPKYRLDADGNPGAFNDVTCVSIEHKLGIHASPTCVLSFGDNGECEGELIGPEFGGMRAMFTMMNNARINVGSQGVQIGERATQQAVAYARERIQGVAASNPGAGPVAIIEHPDVRRMLLRMKALTQAGRALLYYGASQVDFAHLGVEDANGRAELMTPLIKAYGTDMGCEVASLGVQVHGGMGFIEETGAAQHYRDVRITPIYEGTNGIQAADLVGRKLGLEGGTVFDSHIADMRKEAQDAGLIALIDAADKVGQILKSASTNDRLAGSVPFLHMLSVATAGWLMERQGKTAAERLAAGEGDPAFLKMKVAAVEYYLSHVVPEAMGLEAAAMAGADLLYSVDAETFAA